MGRGEMAQDGQSWRFTQSFLGSKIEVIANAQRYAADAKPRRCLMIFTAHTITNLAFDL